MFRSLHGYACLSRVFLKRLAAKRIVTRVRIRARSFRKIHPGVFRRDVLAVFLTVACLRPGTGNQSLVSKSLDRC